MERGKAESQEEVTRREEKTESQAGEGNRVTRKVGRVTNVRGAGGDSSSAQSQQLWLLGFQACCGRTAPRRDFTAMRLGLKGEISLSIQFVFRVLPHETKDRFLQYLGKDTLHV